LDIDQFKIDLICRVPREAERAVSYQDCLLDIQNLESAFGTDSGIAWKHQRHDVASWKATVGGPAGDSYRRASSFWRSAMRPSSLVMAFVLGLIVSPIVFPDGIAPQLHHWVDVTRGKLPIRNN
jgi:hypothetical protein